MERKNSEEPGAADNSTCKRKERRRSVFIHPARRKGRDVGFRTARSVPRKKRRSIWLNSGKSPRRGVKKEKESARKPCNSGSSKVLLPTWVAAISDSRTRSMIPCFVTIYRVFVPNQPTYSIWYSSARLSLDKPMDDVLLHCPFLKKIDFDLTEHLERIQKFIDGK